METARSRNLEQGRAGLNLSDLVYPDVTREAQYPYEEVRLFAGADPDLARDPNPLFYLVHSSLLSGSAPTPTPVRCWLGWLDSVITGGSRGIASYKCRAQIPPLPPHPSVLAVGLTSDT